MTTTQSTVVNYSLRDILRRLSRIQVLNEISIDLADNIVFPRKTQKLGAGDILYNAQYPTTDDIKEMLQRAKLDSLKDVNELGMTINSKSDKVDLPRIIVNNSETDDEGSGEELEKESDDVNEVTSETESLAETVAEVENLLDLEDLNFKDYATSNSKNPSAFLKITLSNGKQKTVRKSSICWLFDERKGRMSADRLFRVRGMYNPKRNLYKNTNQKTTKSIINRSKTVRKTRGNSAKEEDISESDESSECSEELHDSDDEIDELEDIEVIPANQKDIDLQLEEELYYAVYYDITCDERPSKVEIEGEDNVSDDVPVVITDNVVKLIAKDRITWNQTSSFLISKA
ncbi:hypothetical protein RN001_003277 [Aquatica leii]|uniref:Uncharacterized protein n=1 Tax=Aquatica leii TaxID=1421715 RepID=A0AAN7PNG2_9COLE|nr:hypothetical protein RN001_003277 [Aquatica leii]